MNCRRTWSFIPLEAAFVILLALCHLALAQVNPGHRRWQFAMEVTGVQSPAIGSDGTLYIGTGLPDIGPAADALYAIHPNGTLKWKRHLGRAIHSSVALDAEDHLYFIAGEASDSSGMDAVVISLDASGAQRWSSEAIGWQVPVPNTGYTPALAADGTLYACGRYSLYAFDRQGTKKWQYDFPLRDNRFSSGEIFTTGSHHSAPTLGPDGTVYVNTMAGGHGRETVEGGVFAFSPEGSLKWRTHDLGGTAAPVIGADGTIYSAIGRYEGPDSSDWEIASREAKILALHPDGTLKWSVETGLWIEASPSIGADGTLYAGTTHHPLRIPAWFLAISPEGHLKWKYDTHDDVIKFPPAQINPPDIYNSPAIDAKGRIYFGNEIGLLYALSPDGGVEWIDDNIWSLHYESPALASDGTLYVATHSILGVIAFDTGSSGLADSPWPKFRGNNANTGKGGAQGLDGVFSSPQPASFTLEGSYPNPFNSATTLVFDAGEPARVDLAIYNLAGRRVAHLLSAQVPAGRREVRWNGVDDLGHALPSGIYLCRLRATVRGSIRQQSWKVGLIR